MSDLKKSKLLLRVNTPKGVVYEKFVDFLTVKKKDGLMVINKNYSSILEQLPKGNIVVNESSKKVVISVDSSWLTVLDNRCNVYSSVAEVLI